MHLRDGKEGLEIERAPGAGMRPKKAYISKTTEPNLKKEYVLESTWTGASNWR